jgi:hypothetical protein
MRPGCCCLSAAFGGVPFRRTSYSKTTESRSDGLAYGDLLGRDLPFLAVRGNIGNMCRRRPVGALVFSKAVWASLRVGASGPGVKFVQMHVSQLGIKILMSYLPWILMSYLPCSAPPRRRYPRPQRCPRPTSAPSSWFRRNGAECNLCWL